MVQIIPPNFDMQCWLCPNLPGHDYRRPALRNHCSCRQTWPLSHPHPTPQWPAVRLQCPASPYIDLRCGNIMFFKVLYHVAYRVLLLWPWPSCWSRCACALTRWPTAWSRRSRYHLPALVWFPLSGRLYWWHCCCHPRQLSQQNVLSEKHFCPVLLPDLLLKLSHGLGQLGLRVRALSPVSHRSVVPGAYVPPFASGVQQLFKGLQFVPLLFMTCPWQGHLTLRSFVDFGGVLSNRVGSPYLGSR